MCRASSRPYRLPSGVIALGGSNIGRRLEREKVGAYDDDKHPPYRRSRGWTGQPDVKQLEDLDSRLEGSLLRPGDEGWDDAVLIWNGMVAKVPALVLQPTSAHDVAAAVRVRA